MSLVPSGVKSTNTVTVGILCGMAFGVIDILVMLPMKFGDKRKKFEALTGAFIDRFMVGFLIPNVKLGIHPVIIGTLLGLGVVGGAIIGLVTKYLGL